MQSLRVMGVLALLVGAGCGAEPCARLAAVQPGIWVAVDVSGCEGPEAGERTLFWVGGASGAEILEIQAVEGAGPCTIVEGGPTLAQRQAGPWCLTLHVDAALEDAVCVPEDVLAVYQAADLPFVQTDDGWVVALPHLAACDWTEAIGGS